MARDESSPPSQTVALGLNSSSIGLTREHVGEIQRTRMLVAMAEVACERGAGNVSVAHVVDRAGVSRRTFYEIFEDVEDCLSAAFGQAIACASRYLSDAHEPGATWAKRIRNGLEAVLRFLEYEPALGRLAIVESLGVGAKGLELRSNVFDRLVIAVDEGRGSAIDGCSATTMTAEGVVGGVFSVVHTHMLRGDPRRFTELINPLMNMIVLPYLGTNAAREELERHVAEIPSRGRAASANPLKGLDMRLTYRTVRVLTAVATNPGASNRLVGEVAGVGDQGQISKLLARLERLDLVENRHIARSSKGASNAWTLTGHGEEVADVIATRAARL